VVYMGLANTQVLSERLIAAGLPPGTPAAIVENATTPAQRRCLTTLAGLPATVKSEGIEPPALVVIGSVVSLADELDWFVPHNVGVTDDYGQTACEAKR
jgi:siroheme synthase